MRGPRIKPNEKFLCHGLNNRNLVIFAGKLFHILDGLELRNYDALVSSSGLPFPRLLRLFSKDAATYAVYLSRRFRSAG